MWGGITRAFSDRVRTGKRGRPPRICSPGLLRRAGGHDLRQAAGRGGQSADRPGGPEAVAQVLATASGGQHQSNTASSERVNATFRACLSPRARARQQRRAARRDIVAVDERHAPVLECAVKHSTMKDFFGNLFVLL